MAIVNRIQPRDSDDPEWQRLRSDLDELKKNILLTNGSTDSARQIKDQKILIRDLSKVTPSLFVVTRIGDAIEFAEACLKSPKPHCQNLGKSIIKDFKAFILGPGTEYKTGVIYDYHPRHNQRFTQALLPSYKQAKLVNKEDLIKYTKPITEEERKVFGVDAQKPKSQNTALERARRLSRFPAPPWARPSLNTGAFPMPATELRALRMRRPESPAARNMRRAPAVGSTAYESRRLSDNLLAAFARGDLDQQGRRTRASGSSEAAGQRARRANLHKKIKASAAKPKIPISIKAKHCLIGEIPDEHRDYWREYFLERQRYGVEELIAILAETQGERIFAEVKESKAYKDEQKHMVKDLSAWQKIKIAFGYQAKPIPEMGSVYLCKEETIRDDVREAMQYLFRNLLGHDWDAFIVAKRILNELDLELDETTNKVVDKAPPKPKS